MFFRDDTLRWLGGLRAGWVFLVLQRRRSLGRGLGASKMHLGPPGGLGYCPFWGCGSVVVDFFCCYSHCGSLWLFYVLLYVTLCPFWCCSRRGEEGGGWLLCLICLPCVSGWLGGSSSRCRGVVCVLWLWYFLIILTYYFWV